MEYVVVFGLAILLVLIIPAELAPLASLIFFTLALFNIYLVMGETIAGYLALAGIFVFLVTLCAVRMRLG